MTPAARLDAVAVVVPALNEADTIVACVERLVAAGAGRVIVVDNGSHDTTASLAADAGAVVVTEPRRGYGYACAAGSTRAIDDGAEVVAYIDADLSSDPAELGSVAHPVVSGDADLVLGSRMLGRIEAGAMPPHQRFGNVLVAAIMRRLYRVEVTDLGPYRAIDAGMLDRLAMTEMTFGWPVEMMVKAARAEARIVEVPVTWSSRGGGRSKISGTIRGSVLAAWHILRVTLRSFLKRRRTPLDE